MTTLDQKRRKLKISKAVVPALEELRAFVENINKTPDLALRGGVYREIAHADVFTTTVDGVEYGYKLEEHGVMMRRKIFIKFKGYKIEEIPEKEREPFLVAAMEVFIDKGQQHPVINLIAEDCYLLQQDFFVMHLVEKSPGLVVPGGVGHA